MRPHRIVAILICLVPVGLAVIWLEVYALRLEQRIAEMLDRQDQMAEVNARLRASLAEYVSPELLAEHFDRIVEGNAYGSNVAGSSRGSVADDSVWLTRRRETRSAPKR